VRAQQALGFDERERAAAAEAFEGLRNDWLPPTRSSPRRSISSARSAAGYSAPMRIR